MLPSKGNVVENEFFKNKTRDVKNKAIRGSGITIFSTAINTCIAMGGTMVLARILTPEDFGLISMVTAITLLFQNFGLNGFTEAVIQKDEIGHTEVSTLFWVHVIISLLLAVIISLAAPLISNMYEDPRLTLITVVISSGIILTGLYTHHMALMLRQMKFLHTAGIMVAAVAAGTIVAIVMAGMGFGYWSLVFRRLVPVIFTCILCWLFCGWRPGKPGKIREVIPEVKFAMHTYGNFFVTYFSRNVDKIMVGYAHGPRSLGYYNNAYALYALPANQITAPLSNVVLSAMSKYRNDTRQYCHYYFETLKVIAFVGMGISSVLTIIGTDVVVMILGDQWKEAGRIFTMFAPSIGLFLVYQTNGWVHLSLGKADKWFRWSIMATIVTFVFFFVGLPFGPVGVALSYTSAIVVLGVPGIWYAGRPVGMTIPQILTAIWKYIVSLIITISIYFIVYPGVQARIEFTNMQGLLAGILVKLIFAGFFYLFVVICLHGNLGPLRRLWRLAQSMGFDKIIRKSNSDNAPE